MTTSNTDVTNVPKRRGRPPKVKPQSNLEMKASPDMRELIFADEKDKKVVLPPSSIETITAEMQLSTAVATLARKDIRAAAQTLSDSEVVFLLSNYYIYQTNRIRSGNQAKALEKADKPNLLLSHLSATSEQIENVLKVALTEYVKNHPIGSWMIDVYGIGPIISSGFLSKLRVDEKICTAGHFQSYCGLNPTVKHVKGQKLSYDPAMKKNCWFAGQSWLKLKNRDIEENFYGRLLNERLEFETAKNESGANADFAKNELATKNYSKDTSTYQYLSNGMISPAHVLARTCRWTVKLFLSHLFEVMWWHKFNTEPPVIYAVAHLGHVHKIPVPNFEPPKKNIIIVGGKTYQQIG